VQVTPDERLADLPTKSLVAPYQRQARRTAARLLAFARGDRPAMAWPLERIVGRGHWIPRQWRTRSATIAPPRALERSAYSCASSID